MQYFQDMLDRAKSAFLNTSFDSDKRGKELIETLESQLAEDLEELQKRDRFDSEKYIKKFRQFASTYISRQSNCASSAITGRGNFPVERAEKATRLKFKCWDELQAWREKCKRPPRVKKEKTPPPPNCKPDRWYEFEGYKVGLCYSDMRIRIVHNSKPDTETLHKLKKSAFRWSPTTGAWQRQLTDNALSATLNLLNLKGSDLELKSYS